MGTVIYQRQAGSRNLGLSLVKKGVGSCLMCEYRGPFLPQIWVPWIWLNAGPDMHLEDITKSPGHDKKFLWVRSGRCSEVPLGCAHTLCASKCLFDVSEKHFWFDKKSTSDSKMLLGGLLWHVEAMCEPPNSIAHEWKALWIPRAGYIWKHLARKREPPGKGRWTLGM